jgi:hypothetical protein
MHERGEKCTISLENSEGKRQVCRSRSKRDYNIKVYLREIWFEGVDYTPVAHEREPLASSCVQSNEPSGSIEGGEFPSSPARIPIHEIRVLSRFWLSF